LDVEDLMDASASKKRILILGGGFGGVYTARHLERLFKGRSDVEIVLVSRENFLLMTPLLFEVFSGTLEVRHCSFPIRAFLQTTRFVEATVQTIDLERRIVHLDAAGQSGSVAYDQLVLALGSNAWSAPTWRPTPNANASSLRLRSSVAAWLGWNCSVS
jgi:NADH dehydrogenase